MSHSQSEAPGQRAQRRKRSGKARVLVTLAVLGMAVALWVALTHAAGQDRAKTPKSAPQSQAGKTYVPTREITVDAQTGKVRKPTAEETQELVASLSSMLSKSTDGLTAKTLPDGTRQVTLEGRFAPVAIARPREDGTMEVRCVTSFGEAADFLGLVEAGTDQQQAQ
jgi:hypothetical protein